MREGQPAEQSAQFCIGNSPRTRGGQPCAIVPKQIKEDSPRMREGQPSLIATSRNEMRFSPRARGSTLCRAFIGVPFKIHPACAGGNPMF